MAVPESVVNISGGTEVTIQPSKTWGIDKASNRITGEKDGIDAVRQAVEILLNIDRYEWQIFQPYSGNELKKLIGESSSIAQAILQTKIEEALSTDDRIQTIEDFGAVVNGDTITAKFTVKTVYGDFTQETEVAF